MANLIVDLYEFYKKIRKEFILHGGYLVMLVAARWIALRYNPEEAKSLYGITLYIVILIFFIGMERPFAYKMFERGTFKWWVWTTAPIISWGVAIMFLLLGLKDGWLAKSDLIWIFILASAIHFLLKPFDKWLGFKN